MQLVTKQTQIDTIAKRWHTQYPVNKEFGRFSSRIGVLRYKTSDDIWEALKQPGLTEQQIADIIGNDSWTDILCSECDQSVDSAIILGEYESVCQSCLEKAMSLIKTK